MEAESTNLLSAKFRLTTDFCDARWRGEYDAVSQAVVEAGKTCVSLKKNQLPPVAGRKDQSGVTSPRTKTKVRVLTKPKEMILKEVA